MIDAQRYNKRREKLINQIDDGLILIDASSTAPDPMLRDRNLQYLTGLPSRDLYLLLSPKGIMVEHLETRTEPELMRGRRVHSVLFVPEQSPRDIFMDGAPTSLAVLQSESSVDRVYPLSHLDEILGRALMDTDVLWLNSPSVPETKQPLTAHQSYINTIRQRFHWIQTRNIAPLIHQMRFVKDDDEVALLREAFNMQADIFTKVMRALKPGENESLAEIIFDYEVSLQGERVASLMSERYKSSIIVGSGPNSAVPHYMDNNCVIQDGDLVLIDAGISVGGYFSDITRTFPANGRFTPRQRELYAITLEAFYAAVETMKPGSTLLHAHQTVYDTFERYDLAQYGYGNCGHSVGLSVHDPHGRYTDDREQPFKAGVVVAIEPFLILPEDQMGIRIEDGILITERGAEILSTLPLEADAIEAICQ